MSCWYSDTSDETVQFGLATDWLSGNPSYALAGVVTSVADRGSSPEMITWGTSISKLVFNLTDTNYINVFQNITGLSTAYIDGWTVYISKVT